LKHDVILLLDCFFHVLIWRGETIQQWHDLGYHDKPEHENFKNLLMAPSQDLVASGREFEWLGARFKSIVFLGVLT
jgi:protein transport protein SEC23